MHVRSIALPVERSRFAPVDGSGFSVRRHRRRRHRRRRRRVI